MWAAGFPIAPAAHTAQALPAAGVDERGGQDGEGAQSAAFTNGTASRNGILVRRVERKIS